jgi:hypothetical protein
MQQVKAVEAPLGLDQFFVLAILQLAVLIDPVLEVFAGPEQLQCLTG